MAKGYSFILARLVAMVLPSVGIVFGCDCMEPSVQAKLDHSEVVFRGTIIAVRDTERTADIPRGFARDTKKVVVFAVNRVWKGEVGKNFEMSGIEETAACIGFWPGYLKVGSDLLVYAWRAGAEYITGICGSHKLAKDSAKDFAELGVGREPEKMVGRKSK